MRRRMLVLIVAAVLAQGAHAAPASDILPGFKPSADQAQQIADAEALVKQSLKDPESAKFRNLFTSETPNHTPVVCGEVNAKNSMGGYSGFERMFVLGAGSSKSVHMEEDSSIFSAVWDKACKR